VVAVNSPHASPAAPSRWLGCSALGVLALLLPPCLEPAGAQPRNFSGSIGLIDMPSARMASDGLASIGLSFFEKTQHYSLNFQALPWLEGSFRYTGLTTFNTDFPVYYDRAFGLKVRLLEESGTWPAVAIGTKDLVGTGVYSGEYVVASKQIGPLDFTLGMGWGRLASANTIRNPLTLISDSFRTRAANDVGQGGNFSFGRYFHGPDAGIFGGVAWETPVQGLTLMAEYSSDSYTEETITSNFAPRSQVNFGASYQLGQNVTLGAGWIYGRSVYGTLAFSIDPTEDSYTDRLGPPLPPPYVRSEDEQQRSLEAARRRRDGSRPVADEMLADVLWRNAQVQDVAIVGQTLNVRVINPSPALCSTLAHQIAPYAGDILRLSLNGVQCPIANPPTAREIALRETWPPLVLASTGPLTIDASGPRRPSGAEAEARIRRNLQAQNIRLLALSLRDGEASLYYENSYYNTEAEAIDRLLRILMADAPENIEVFRFISVESGLPNAQVVIPRGTAERAFAQQGTYNIFRDQGRHLPAPAANPLLYEAQRDSYPAFNWSIAPQLRQQLFDPNNPVGVQLLLGAEAVLEILPGTRLMAQADIDILNTFDVTRTSNSVLPHVRSDFVNYFAKGKTGIGILQLEQNFRLNPSTFVSLRAGYLESMFAGLGGEVLWRPEGQRWALGWDLYYVKQREFDRLFGLKTYNQTTGHMTLYYESPWYNLDFQFRIGRYLAGDWGTTVQVSRRFASGIEVGVFATKTNVSAKQFGEGSFDKGIIIRMPLSALLPIHTQQSFDMNLRPIQRDGGQTLNGDAQLYGRLRRASEGELRRTSLD
jgi:hypothetical protein